MSEEVSQNEQNEEASYETPTPMQQIRILQEINQSNRGKSIPQTPEEITKRQSLNLIKQSHVSATSANFREYIEILGSQAYKPKFESKEKIDDSMIQTDKQQSQKKQGLVIKRLKNDISDDDCVKIKTDNEDNVGFELAINNYEMKEERNDEKQQNQHVDTSPRRMDSIQESDDVKLPTLPKKQSNEAVPSQADETSRRERVSLLERKYGGYRMISNIVNYDELKKDQHFSIIKFKDAVYRGLILNTDKREGQGVMIYDNGRIYEGSWQNDKRHGKGFERYSNGNIYEGMFERGKANGEGVYKWKNGELYEGEWLNGVKHGYGSWKNSYGESYVGDWKDNKANGKGAHIWSTGDKYEGDWLEFLKHGFGTDYFANGDQYTGEYRFGKPYGRGKYMWSTGAEYEGDFEDGKKCGQGKWEKKIYRDDGTLESHVYYIGEYANELKNGYGEYKWASGNLYKGHYNDDKRHGYGEMHWCDGSVYQGEWHSGVQHGFGRMIFANGETKEGLFEGGAYKVEGSEEQIRDLMKNSTSNLSSQKTQQQSSQQSIKNQKQHNNSKVNKKVQIKDNNSNSKTSRNANKLGAITNPIVISIKKQRSTPDLQEHRSQEDMNIKRKLLPQFINQKPQLEQQNNKSYRNNSYQNAQSHNSQKHEFNQRQYNRNQLPQIIEIQPKRKYPQSLSPSRKQQHEIKKASPNRRQQQQQEMVNGGDFDQAQHQLQLRNQNNSVLQNAGQQMMTRQLSSHSLYRQESSWGLRHWIPAGPVQRNDGCTVNTKVQLI